MATANQISLEPERLNVIRALAHEFHRPVDEVNKTFTQTFEKLNSEARIKDYLIVLTIKKVRDELR